MQKSSQKGFSFVDTLMVIIIVAGVVAAAWHIWSENYGKKSTTKSTNSNTQTQPQQKPKDPSEGGKYLVIKEWGVRFLLPEDLRGDIYYILSDTSNSGTIIFGSKKLDGLTGDTTCKAMKSPDGSYSGGVEASLASLNPTTYDKNYLDYYKSQLDYIKKIDDYEYYSRQDKKPLISCLTGQHEEYSPIEQSISDQLNAAFKQLEKY